jgi:calcium-dependent protein kinase
MKVMDLNNSGSIDYSEFVAATINRTKLLSQDRL